MPKQDHYRTFIGRLEVSLADGHYLESAWYAYAVLEDRLRSLLRSSGTEFHSRTNRQITMMGPKLRELKERRARVPLLAAEFSDALHDALDVWKEDRNNLTHAMADATMTVADIDASAKKLAVDGARLVRDYCALCRRMKKQAIK
jgi:cytochrome c2